MTACGTGSAGTYPPPPDQVDRPGSPWPSTDLTCRDRYCRTTAEWARGPRRRRIPGPAPQGWFRPSATSCAAWPAPATDGRPKRRVVRGCGQRVRTDPSRMRRISKSHPAAPEGSAAHWSTGCAPMWPDNRVPRRRTRCHVQPRSGHDGRARPAGLDPERDSSNRVRLANADGYANCRSTAWRGNLWLDGFRALRGIQLDRQAEITHRTGARFSRSQDRITRCNATKVEPGNRPIADADTLGLPWKQAYRSPGFRRLCPCRSTGGHGSRSVIALGIAVMPSRTPTACTRWRPTRPPHSSARSPCGPAQR